MSFLEPARWSARFPLATACGVQSRPGLVRLSLPSTHSRTLLSLPLPRLTPPSLDGVALGSRLCRCLRSPGTPFAACDGDGDGNPFGNETDTRNCRTTTTTTTITTTVSPPRFASHPSPDRPGAGDNSDRCHLDLDCSPQGLRIRPFRSPGARPRPVPTRHHQRHVRVEFRPPIPRLFVRSRRTGI